MSIEDNGLPFGVAERLDDVLLRFDGWRARPVVALSIGLLILAIAAVGWWLGQPAPAVPLDELIPMAQPEGERASGETPTDGGSKVDLTAAEYPVPPGDGVADEEPDPDLVVHVVGAVRVPGLVTVKAGSRVGDVVAAAGGAVDGADTQRLNMAAPISDGMQVRVPLLDADPDEPLIVIPVETSVGQREETAGPVNLNAASIEQLESLPGVGPSIAAAIVSWREENGGFANPDDLLQVPGIGPAKMGALRDRVTT